MSKVMKYNFLGKSGLRVSEICLGTMTFGERKGAEDLVQASEEESHALLNRFVELGGNFIDTADAYQNGTSEEIIGKWIAKRDRSKIILATKVRSNMDPEEPNAVGLSRGHIMNSIDASLKRLQTNYIDLYQMHAFDYAVPLEETLSAFNDLVRMGKIRYIGVSNVLGWQLQKMVDITQKNNWAPIVSLQQQWSLLCRQTEWELLDVCRIEGIGIIPWSPLKGGWLTGKVKKNMEMPKDSRVAWVTAKGQPNQSHPSFDVLNKDKTWEILDEISGIAKKNNKTMAQVALRWLQEKDVVPSVIIGAKKISQLEDNIGACGDQGLSDEEMKALDDVSEPEIPYPYEMVRRVNVDRRRLNWTK